MAFCAILQIFLAKNAFAIYYIDWNYNPNIRSKNVLELDENNADYNVSQRPVKLISIATEPKPETLATYLPSAVRNFKSTEGLLYAICWVFILTFIVFPGVSNHSYYKFLEGIN